MDSSSGEAAPGVLYAGAVDAAGPGLARQIAAVAGLGWRLIELPRADLDDAAYAYCLRALGAAGLTAACVHARITLPPAPGALAADLAELDRLAPRCAALGTRYVRVGTAGERGPDAIFRTRLLAARAASYGLVLLYAAGEGGGARLLADIAHPALRLALDVGAGRTAFVARLLERCPEAVAHVRVRGTERVTEELRLLLDHGYVGVWSVAPGHGRGLARLVASDVAPRTVVQLPGSRRSAA